MALYVTVGHIIQQEKTMRTRYRVEHIRKGLFSKKAVLVLQVLKAVPDGPPDSNGMPSSLAGEYWVDAQVEDLTGPLGSNLQG